MVDIGPAVAHPVRMSPPVIRTAELGDLDAVRSLFRRSSLSNDGDREVLLANPDALVFDAAPIRAQRTRVAVDGDRLVGFATTCPVGEIDELEDLFVDPGSMRRGIATALVADATAIARARGATCLEVTANGHALDFYVAVGFVEAGIAETTFGPAVRMRLDLGSAGDSRKWRQRRC